MKLTVFVRDLMLMKMKASNFDIKLATIMAFSSYGLGNIRPSIFGMV